MDEGTNYIMADTLIAGTTLVENIKKVEVKSTIESNTFDFLTVDFTTDGTFKSLDISNIVPEGTEWVIIEGIVKDDVANSKVEFNGTGIATVNKFAIETQVANVTNRGNGWVKISSNRLLYYKADNLTFTDLNIKIIGYL